MESSDELNYEEKNFLKHLSMYSKKTYPRSWSQLNKQIMHHKLIRLGFLTGMMEVTESGKEIVKEFTKKL